jgi:hypothetical protein
VQDPLAHKLMHGDFVEGDAVLVDVKEGAGELEFSRLTPVGKEAVGKEAVSYQPSAVS